MKQLSFSVDLDDEVQCRKSFHLVASILLRYYTFCIHEPLDCSKNDDPFFKSSTYWPSNVYQSGFSSGTFSSRTDILLSQHF